MKRMALLAGLALASCASVLPAPTGPAGFGQVTAVEGVQVRPLELLEDSRCPASVQCVWAGQVRIRAQVTDQGGRELRELTLGKPIAVGGGRLTLIDVQPPKLAPGTTGAAQYRFAFSFER